MDWGEWLSKIMRTRSQRHGTRSSEDVDYTPKYLDKSINTAGADFPSLSDHCDSLCYVFFDRNVYLALNTFSAGYTSQQSCKIPVDASVPTVHSC